MFEPKCSRTYNSCFVSAAMACAPALRTSVSSANNPKTKQPAAAELRCASYGKMPPKEVNPFGNPKPFLRAAAAGGAKDAVQPPSPAAGDDSAAAPQKSKKQMHRKDKVVFWVAR